MKFYSFSPIKNEKQLRKAIEHTHFGAYRLCKDSFGRYFQNAGNIGIFCHYDDEYTLLTSIREKLTDGSNTFNQKYFKLREPIVIKAKRGVPEAIYTHLYIRKPDPYRHHAGDIDFFVHPEEYKNLKDSVLAGNVIPNARIFDRKDWDMIELYNPDVDVLAYVSTHQMTQKVHFKTTT